MKVLGVDPGTAATGYGVVRGDGDSHRLLECGVVRTDSGDPLADRLAEIHRGLVDVVERHGPACVVVEGVYSGPNVRTAVVLGHARGAAVLAGALSGVEVVEYPASEIKKAVTGSGRASKEQVGLLVQDHLSLKEPPSPEDAADGCAAALCHFFLGTGPLAERRP